MLQVQVGSQPKGAFSVKPRTCEAQSPQGGMLQPLEAVGSSPARHEDCNRMLRDRCPLNPQVRLYL